MSTKTSRTEPEVYFVVFEEYLQPKLAFKTRKLQSFGEKTVNESHVKGSQQLEHRPSSIQMPFYKRCYSRLGKVFGIQFRIPKFFSFLHQSNNENACKRKTNFDIYCEMASAHGFVNFIHARPLQRLFWSLVIFLAICMSCFVIKLSFTMSMRNPTIYYIEGITDSAWSIRFPAVTICNLNRISQREALKVADKFLSHSSLTRQEILRLFRLTLYASQDVNVTQKDLVALEVLMERNNYTITKLLGEISTRCTSEEFKLCKWKAHHERCQQMLREVNTAQGICCAFNLVAYQRDMSSYRPENVTSCGHQTGLSIAMNPNVHDFNLSKHKFVGYEVYIHDSADMPNELTEKQLVSARTETSISILPRSVYGTHYLRTKSVSLRRCYFPDEHKLLKFKFYSLPNCLAECRSRLMYAKCNCIPPFWPKLVKEWIFCQTALQINCSLNNRDIFSQVVTSSGSTDFEKRRSENFICDCLPLCSYNQYVSVAESSPLDRNFSLVEKRLFRGVTKIESFTLLHVFYGDLTAEKFRHDVIENWLSSIGTIGGIAGLYMGFSFVSVFELIFFVFVRPLCNWVTKRQIRYEKTKKQNRIAIEKAKEKEKEAQALEIPEK